MMAVLKPLNSDQPMIGTDPRRAGWSLRSAWGRLVRLNARIEASIWGDIAATALFGGLTYALFIIGGILQ